MEEKELLAGTIVHVYGIPVELAEHVKVRTFTGNWALIEDGKRAHAEVTDRVAQRGPESSGSSL